MLKVVVSNNTAIFRELKSPAFQSLEVVQEVVTAGDEALEKIRETRPDLAVLDVDLPGLSGYEVCKTVKADADLAKTRVILVVTGSPGRAEVDLLSDSGCDDILTIPTPAEDLYSHAARLLNLPKRQRSRVLAQVVMPTGAFIPVIRGEATDVGLDAVTINVEHHVELGTEVRLRLGRAGAGLGVVVRGTVVACEDSKSSLTKTLRVKLTGLRPEDERALADLALWQVVERREGILVIVRGDITERTDFAPLLEQVMHAQDIVFDLGAVRYLNSTGVLRWVNFIEQLSPEATYSFVRCSPAFVSQFGLVAHARGRGKIVSFMAPYYCEMCDRETEQLLQSSSLAFPDGQVPKVPEFDCPKCGGPLALDDIPERFFAFTRSTP
jgi:CheY-like chemotaxis protein